jgi:hypothetical protein
LNGPSLLYFCSGVNAFMTDMKTPIVGKETGAYLPG